MDKIATPQKIKLNTKVAVIIISLIASFATCYFAAPTVFGGRDQGSIATAAIYLSKNHSLRIDNSIARDLFQKYGPGKSLNFPGFDYTKAGKLVSRFPAGYTSYLAGAYSLFGLKGIQYANFLPLFLFFILFWLTLRQFFSEKISFLGFLLAATFFPFLWFAKYTLTEIFMLFLVWGGIYFLILSLLSLRAQRSNPVQSENTRSPRSLWSLAMTGWLYLGLSVFFFALSALTRIEGILFFLLAIAYILVLQKKNIIPKPKNFNKFLLISTLFLLIFYIFLNFPALLDSAKNIVKAFLPNSTKDSAPSASLYARLVILFFKYNFLAYLILGLAGIFLLARKMRQNWTKPEFLIIFILFPSFFYLVSPLISLDDPWLFRRYVFSIFPVLIFYSIYFLNRYNKNKILINAIFAALIISNLLITSQYVTYSENKNLLPQVESLSKKFGDGDLILVDRLASGSGWSLISEPLSALYNKQAVYFFNAEDLNYVSKNQYKNIFLIAPLAQNRTWYNTLEKELIDTVIVNNNFLTPSQESLGLAQNQKEDIQAGVWKLK